MAAESSAIKNAVLNALTLLDGTGSPVSLALSYDDGDFSGSNLSQFLNEAVAIERRGKFISLVHGKRRYPEISFSTYVGNVVGSTAVAPGTPYEFATGKGAYSANVSTLGTGRPMAVDVKLSKEGTNVGDGNDETVTFEDCRLTGTLAEGMEGDKINWTGVCYGAVVHGHSTNTPSLTQVT